MLKSKYGKETTYLWQGFIKPEQIELVPTRSTLHISESDQREIDDVWADPQKKDGGKWRTELVHDAGEKLLIYVSPVKYSQHDILRSKTGQPIGFYPNPLTINTMQETEDGYILAGVRGKVCDQRGLALLGAGFVDRHEEGGVSKKPLPLELLFTVQNECLDETAYKRKSFDPPFYVGDARAVCAVFGSNHDTTIGFYLPISATSKEIEPGNEEYTEILPISNNPQEIKKFLEEGGYKGIPAADQMLGCLESYLLYKESGKIKSRFQN